MYWFACRRRFKDRIVAANWCVRHRQQSNSQHKHLLTRVHSHSQNDKASTTQWHKQQTFILITSKSSLIWLDIQLMLISFKRHRHKRTVELCWRVIACIWHKTMQIFRSNEHKTKWIILATNSSQKCNKVTSDFRTYACAIFGLI